MQEDLKAVESVQFVLNLDFMLIFFKKCILLNLMEPTGSISQTIASCPQTDGKALFLKITPTYLIEYKKSSYCPELSPY